ncbi:MAG: tagG 2 [Planctomycetota bacterium]|nr:tagG 2 [Planctomycetota bacterium]
MTQLTHHMTDAIPSELQESGGDLAELPIVEIHPRSGWRSLDLKEMWRYRELFLFFTWRDVMVRYKQTVLGAAWAILQPLMTMVVFSVFFGRLAGVSSGDLPYPLFAFAGLLPWTFFANAIGNAGQSVVGSERLITKVYFPRLIIPITSVMAGLVDFLIACIMLGLLMGFYQVSPKPTILLAPLIVAGLVLAAIGVGSLVAAMNVAYRDFRYVIPFLTQLWMFATPTVYMQADGAFSRGWSAYLPLNPAYGLIANFRSAVMGGRIDAGSLIVSMTVAIALFLAGTLYFRRVERRFADII